MYNSEQFLKYSKQYLQAEISDESITQVRDVKLISKTSQRLKDMQQLMSLATQAVIEWLVSILPTSRVERKEFGFPDIIVYDDYDRRIGYEVRVIRSQLPITATLRDAAYRAYFEINENRLEDVTIVIVLDDSERLEEVTRSLHRYHDLNLGPRVKFLIGLLEMQEETSSLVFRPIENIVPKIL
jgi:hypothetical protein